LSKPIQEKKKSQFVYNTNVKVGIKLSNQNKDVLV